MRESVTYVRWYRIGCGVSHLQIESGCKYKFYVFEVKYLSNSSVHLHCKHFAPPALHHRYQELCNIFLIETFFLFFFHGRLAWYFSHLHGIPWRLEESKDHQSNWDHMAMWVQKLAFGFLSPDPEDAEMNSKLCQDCSVWFETFDQPMLFIISAFMIDIFTQFIKHISSINIIYI